MLVQMPSGPADRSAQPSPAAFMLASTVIANEPALAGTGPSLTWAPSASASAREPGSWSRYLTAGAPSASASWMA
jgi:hypothetical protein